MTVIAWDGTTLAADKQSTSVGYGSTVTKVHRVPHGILAVMGDGACAMAIVRWFKSGSDMASFPYAADPERSASAVFITKSGQVRFYCNSPHYEVYEDEFAAFGSGRDYALTAMFLGLAARDAVAVACELDINCGNGIDTLTLER